MNISFFSFKSKNNKNLCLYLVGFLIMLFSKYQVNNGTGSAVNLHSNKILSSNCRINGFCKNTGFPDEFDAVSSAKNYIIFNIVLLLLI